MRGKLAGRLAIGAVWLALGAAQAVGQETTTITLTSLDGKVVMVGQLQGVEAGYYSIIVTGLGLVRIAQDLVTCQSSSIDCGALVNRS